MFWNFGTMLSEDKQTPIVPQVIVNNEGKWKLHISPIQSRDDGVGVFIKIWNAGTSFWYLVILFILFWLMQKEEV